MKTWTAHQSECLLACLFTFRSLVVSVLFLLCVLPLVCVFVREFRNVLCCAVFVHRFQTTDINDGCVSLPSAAATLLRARSVPYRSIEFRISLRHFVPGSPH